MKAFICLCLLSVALISAHASADPSPHIHRKPVRVTAAGNIFDARSGFEHFRVPSQGTPRAAGLHTPNVRGLHSGQGLQQERGLGLGLGMPMRMPMPVGRGHIRPAAPEHFGQHHAYARSGHHGHHATRARHQNQNRASESDSESGKGANNQ